MRTKKKTLQGPPSWSPYAVKGMTREEVAPLLWKQKIIHTIPGIDTQAMEYGIPVRVDGKSKRLLCVQHTWLTLTWLLEQQEAGMRKDPSAGAYGITPRWTWSPTATCKVMIHGIDDIHYGAWLTRRTHKDFVETWHALRAFIWINEVRVHGLTGTQLIEYCEATLGVSHRDYN